MGANRSNTLQVFDRNTVQTEHKIFSKSSKIFKAVSTYNNNPVEKPS